MAKAAGTINGAQSCQGVALEGPSFTMLVLNLRSHFPARMSEWANAAILTSWGAYLLLHPGLFDEPGLGVIFAKMKSMVWVDMAPEAVWGFVAFVVGSIRLLALFINGAYSRTPMIRLATAAVSAFVWTQVVIGLFGVPNTGLVVYPWLVVIDLISAYRAGMDVALAEKRRKDVRLGMASVSSIGSRAVG